MIKRINPKASCISSKDEILLPESIGHMMQTASLPYSLACERQDDLQKEISEQIQPSN